MVRELLHAPGRPDDARVRADEDHLSALARNRSTSSWDSRRSICEAYRGAARARSRAGNRRLRRARSDGSRARSDRTGRRSRRRADGSGRRSPCAALADAPGDARERQRSASARADRCPSGARGAAVPRAQRGLQALDPGSWWRLLHDLRLAHQVRAPTSGRTEAPAVTTLPLGISRGEASSRSPQTRRARAATEVFPPCAGCAGGQPAQPEPDAPRRAHRDRAAHAPSRRVVALLPRALKAPGRLSGPAAPTACAARRA